MMYGSPAKTIQVLLAKSPGMMYGSLAKTIASPCSVLKSEAVSDGGMKYGTGPKPAERCTNRAGMMYGYLAKSDRC
jgi:hypothetical protein